MTLKELADKQKLQILAECILNIFFGTITAFLFFSGVRTLAEVYPNYYLNLAIFTVVYIALLKMNKMFINYRNREHTETVLNDESTPLLRALLKISNLSTGMLFAYYICIIGLISGWHLLLNGNEFIGLLFISSGALSPLAMMVSEEKSY
jgi:hypothetical protein